MSHNTAKKVIDKLVKLNILAQEENKQRNKVFIFKEYFEILELEY